MSDTTDLRELDIQIAKALGWQLVRGEHSWELYAPDGSGRNSTFDVDRWTEDRAWANIWYQEDYRSFAHYSSVLNAAASLPIDEGYRLVVTVSHDQKAIATFQYWSVLSEIWFSDIERAADTEAEARALAWLARHEGKLQAAKTNAGSLS